MVMQYVGMGTEMVVHTAMESNELKSVSVCYNAISSGNRDVATIEATEATASVKF